MTYLIYFSKKALNLYLLENIKMRRSIIDKSTYETFPPDMKTAEILRIDMFFLFREAEYRKRKMSTVVISSPNTKNALLYR